MHVLRYIKIVILLVTSRISVVFPDDNAEVEALAKQISRCWCRPRTSLIKATAYNCLTRP